MAKRLNYQIGVTADTTQFKVSLNDITQSLQKLGATAQLAPSLQQASAAAAELAMHLNSATDDSGKLNLSAFNNSLVKNKKTLSDYRIELEKLGPAGQEAFLNITQAIMSAELPLKRTSKLMSELWVTMKNTIRWQLTSSTLHGFVGSLETAYGYSKSLNSSLNSIRIVTQKSAEDMRQFAKEANSAAKALSTTTVDYTDASLIYYQQGLSDEQVKARTETTIKLANVSHQAGEDVSDQLTAIWNNFYDGSKSLEYYGDAMVALGASTASSSDEIAQGIQKFAAVAGTVGLSYEYAAAALATLTANTRESADIVGTALRTLFARLQGLKLGETLDDGTDLNKYSSALNTVGVNIKTVDGELKSMDIILDEVAEKWATLSKDQQMALAQTVAGVRQYTQFLNLMNNWGDFQQNLQTIAGSEGALQVQADIYAESWEAARDRVKASSEDIYDSLINPDFYIALDDNVTPLLSIIADIIDAMGGMNGVLATGALLFNKIYGDKISSSIRDMATNINIMSGVERDRVRTLQEKAAIEAKEIVYAQSDNELKNLTFNAQKKIVDLQLQSNKQMDYLSEYQGKILTKDIERIKNLYTQAELLEKQNELYKEQSEQAEQYLLEHVGKNKEWKDNLWTQSFKDSETGKFKKNAAGKEINLALDSENETIALDKLIYSLKDAIKQEERYKAIHQELKASNEQITPTIEKMVKALNIEGITADSTADDIAEYISVEGAFEEQSKEQSNKVRALREAIEQLGNGTNFYNNKVLSLMNSWRNSEISAEDLREQLDKLDKEFSEFGNNLDSNNYAIKDWADAIISIGNGLSMLTMSVNAVQSLGRIFSDEDMTNGERITAILTSLSMLLPAAVSAMKALNVITKTAVVIENGLVKVKGEGILAGWAKVAADKVQATTQKVLGESTAATTASIAAQLTLLLPYIAAIAAVTVVIFGLVKAHNADADAAKAATATVETLNDEYKELKNTYEELKNTIQDYQDAYDAIGQLTEGTDEFADAIDKANAKALELIENNKSLAAFAQRSNNGAIIFKDNALAQYQKQQKQQLINIQVASLVSQRQANDLQLKSDTTNLRRQISYVIEDDLETPVKAIISNDQIQNILSLIKENNGSLINSDLDKLGDINSNLKSAILDNTNELIALADSMDEVAEINRFLNSEIIHTYFANENEDYNKLTSAGQNAVDAILANMGINSSSYLSLSQIRDEYAKEMGYEVGHYTDTGFLGQGFSTSYFDIATGEKVADISNSVAEAYVRQQKALKEIDATQYIKTVDIIAQSAEKLNIDGLSDDLLGFIQQVDTAFDILNTLSYEEYLNLKDNLPGLLTENLKNIDWNGLGYNNTEEYLAAVEKALENWNAEDYFLNLANKYSKFTNDALNIFDLIDTDDFEQAAQSLVQQAKEIYSVDILGDLTNQSLFDQAVSITEALIDIANPEKIAEAQQKYTDNIKETIDALEEEKEALIEEQRFARKLGEEDYAQSLNHQIDSIEDRINNLKIDPIEIEIDYDEVQIKGMLSQLDQISKAAKLIEDDYSVSADNIEELFKTLPELFDDAIIDIETGNLQLNRELINSFLNMGNEMRLANGQLLSDILVQRVENAQQQLNLAQEVKQAIIGANGEITADTIANSGIEESTRKTLAENIIKAKIKERIETTQESVQILSDTTNDSKQQAKIAEHYSKETTKQWAQSAQDIYLSFRNAFTGMLENQKQFTEGKDIINYFNNIRVITSSNYGVDDSVDYKIIREKVENPNQELLDFVNGEDKDFDFDLISSSLKEIFDMDISSEDLESGKWYDKFWIGGEDNNQAAVEKALNEYLSKKVYELGANTVDLSKYLNRSNSLDKKPSSSSVSKKDAERYHEINRELEKQADLLNEIDTQIDRTYGKNRLDLYVKKQKELNNETSLYKDKIAEAEKYLLSDKAKIQSIPGLKMDSATGEILNFTELSKQWSNMYSSVSDEQKEQIDNWIKWIQQYEETLDIIKELNEEIINNAREMEDLDLEKINHAFEIKLDRHNLKKNLNEWQKTLAESYSDALYYNANIGSIALQQANQDIDLVADEITKYNQLADKWSKATSETDKNAIKEEMANLQQQIISTGEDLLGFVETMESLLPDAISAAADRFGDFTGQLSHNVSILNATKDLLALEGVTYKTSEGFKTLNKILESRKESQTQEMLLNKQYNEMMRQQLSDAEAALAKAKEGDVEYDKLKADRDAILEQYNSSLEAMLQSAQDVMNTAKDIFTMAIESASYKFEQKMSDSLGFDLMQDQFDHFIEEEERYFDEVNELYQINSWNNKLQKDIDNTTNKVYADRLKALQDEINLRAEGNKLSQYDLDVLEAEYNLLLAKQALEDAQNAKTDLRLVRDRQGNWNYQYTANQDTIDDAQNDVLKAQNDWYNISKDQTKKMTAEIIKIYKEFNSAVQDVYNDQVLSDEQKAEKLEEIERYYTEKITYLETEKNIAIKDMTDAGLLTVDNFKNDYASHLDSLDGETEKFKNYSKKYLDECEDAFKSYEGSVKEGSELIGTYLGGEDGGLTQILNDINKANEDIAESGPAAIDAMAEKIDSIKDITDAFLEMAGAIKNALYQLDEYAHHSTKQDLIMTGETDDVDYSALMAYAWAEQGGRGAQGFTLLSNARREKMTDEEAIALGYMTTDELLSYFSWNSEREDKENDAMATKLIWQYAKSNGLSYEDALEKLRKQYEKIVKYDTGGYTGSFNNGKLAFLHEKELVLNPSDTENILSAVTMIRMLGDEFFRNIETSLDNNIAIGMSALKENIRATNGITPIREAMEQEVHIEANFPNVTNSTEIEEALRNLTNDAAQWARRRQD